MLKLQQKTKLINRQWLTFLNGWKEKCKSIYARLLTLMIAASMMMGCASGARPIVASPQRIPPASLTKECQDLPQPITGQLGDLLSNHIEITKICHQCAKQLKSLVDWNKSQIK